MLRSLITYIYSGCNEVRIVRWKESFEESVHAKRPENTMVKRKRDKKLHRNPSISFLCSVLSIFLYVFFWPLCYLVFSFGHCVVWPFLLAIVLYGLFFWHLCCLTFCDLWILITPLIYSFITCVTIVCMSTFQLPINLLNHSVR